VACSATAPPSPLRRCKNLSAPKPYALLLSTNSVPLLTRVHVCSCVQRHQPLGWISAARSPRLSGIWRASCQCTVMVHCFLRWNAVR
jgi:hypothetical protein